MAKVYGPKECYIPVREDATRTIVSYDYMEEPDGVNATWYEIYFNKKNGGKPSIEHVKDAIINDIDARTDALILESYEWTILHGDEEGKHAGETVKVWLSKENQSNYKAAYDAAITTPGAIEFPIMYKINEDSEHKGIYDTFANVEELGRFYLGGLAYIKQLLDDGWKKKDSFDFTPYEWP